MIFTGSPIIVKWISIESNSLGTSDVRASILNVEKLAVNQQWSDKSLNGCGSTWEVLRGYGWMFVGTDQPHGTVVKWNVEEPREAGSFQPIVNVHYERNFSVLLHPGERKCLNSVYT